MSVGIFIMGSIVTALVGGALWLLVWGAVLDGRDDDLEAAEVRPLDGMAERLRAKPMV